MLWTVFAFLMVVWMVALTLHFGGAAIPMLLVLALLVLLLKLVIRRTSFN
ncbi:MAG TPA: DUF5670 family protein [Terriglobales bacterium]|jgi:hypothetical protein|nr:DUF5670 family protein [Terriglobales bacterium]